MNLHNQASGHAAMIDRQLTLLRAEGQVHMSALLALATLANKLV